jgi:hypothetical protein
LVQTVFEAVSAAFGPAVTPTVTSTFEPATQAYGYDAYREQQPKVQQQKGTASDYYYKRDDALKNIVIEEDYASDEDEEISNDVFESEKQEEEKKESTQTIYEGGKSDNTSSYQVISYMNPTLTL